jgi:hypothetical protein
MTKFTSAKKRVRELNLGAMKECLRGNGRRWAYFGLPSPEMEDVLAWKDYLVSVDAVERGMQGREWKAQHDMVRVAIKNGIPNFRRHSADIDEIILSDDGLTWQFDVVNLDYTGGITYKGEDRRSKRISSLQSLIAKQGTAGRSFFLTITVNDRHQDSGEIRRVLLELAEFWDSVGFSDESITLKASVISEDKRLAVFLYTAYIVVVAGQRWYRTRVLKPIFYPGRGGYQMVNMTFCLHVVQNLDAPAGGTQDTARIARIRPIAIDEQEAQ